MRILEYHDRLASTTAASGACRTRPWPAPTVPQLAAAFDAALALRMRLGGALRGVDRRAERRRGDIGQRSATTRNREPGFCCDVSALS
jgi:hypothetical protein